MSWKIQKVQKNTQKKSPAYLYPPEATTDAFLIYHCRDNLYIYKHSCRVSLLFIYMVIYYAHSSDLLIDFELGLVWVNRYNIITYISDLEYNISDLEVTICSKITTIKIYLGAFLVVQWLRNHLAMQETQVQFLGGDPISCATTKTWSSQNK